MTDKDIILNYINNYYVFHYEEHQVSSHVRTIHNVIIGFQNKSTNSFTSFGGLINELKLLYGDFICDNGNMIDDYVRDWFTKEKNKHFKEVYEKLSELRVELGETNWVVIDKDNQPFNFDDLEPLFLKYQSRDVVKEIYDEWFDKKVTAISEEIMGANYE